MGATLSAGFRTAFVTGASGGLGRAFASMLCREGVQVWGTSRDPERLLELASEHPGHFRAAKLDLTQPGQAVAEFERLSSVAGGFDLLINNAGYGVFGEFASRAATDWNTQVEGMLLTTLRLTRSALPPMLKARRGTIVHVSSVAAEIALPYMSGYNVAKAGLSALSESLMFEIKGRGVRVIDLRPGDFRTLFNQAMDSRSAASAASDPRQAAAWAALETNLKAGPAPEKAAADLRKALLSGKSGVVYTGSFFQTRVATLANRLLPRGLMRSLTSSHYGI